MVDTVKLDSIIQDISDAGMDAADALEKLEEMTEFLQTSETAGKAYDHVEKALNCLDAAEHLLEEFRFAPGRCK